MPEQRWDFIFIKILVSLYILWGEPTIFIFYDSLMNRLQFSLCFSEKTVGRIPNKKLPISRKSPNVQFIYFFRELIPGCKNGLLSGWPIPTSRCCQLLSHTQSKPDHPWIRPARARISRTRLSCSSFNAPAGFRASGEMPPTIQAAAALMALTKGCDTS